MHSFRVKSTAVLAAMLSFLPTLVLADALPAGPYQLRDATFIVVGATFDAEAVRIALPKNLEPTDNVTGGINLYIAPEGWGLAPFSAGYIWVDVKGHDTASGPARYQVAAFYSDKAFELLKDLGTVEGTTSEEETEGVVTATGSIGGEPAITLSLRPSSSQCAPEAGVHNYVAPPGADGAATFMFVVLCLSAVHRRSGRGRAFTCADGVQADLNPLGRVRYRWRHCARANGSAGGASELILSS